MKLKDQITKGLMNFAKGNPYDIVIPNFFLGRWECDMFKLTKSGLVVEYEIKTTVSDYKKDFEKAIGKYDEHYNVVKHLKHDAVKAGQRCNRFIFVCPEEIVSKIVVPEYCGLLSYHNYGNRYGYFKVVKNAKIISKTRYDTLAFYRELATSLAFREQILRIKIDRLNEKRED